jgi:NADH dehydrogenase
MSALFLTGGSGFVGRFVLEQLERTGHRITVLRRTPGDASAESDAVRFVTGDLLDPSSWHASLAGIDTIVHLAAATGSAPREVHDRVNAEGTARLLEAGARAGVRNVLFISSIAVRFADAPHYHYAASKRAAEAAVQGSGLQHTILRPTIVLGPGSPIGARFRALARLPLVPVFAGGRVRVQPIDVRDLAMLIAAVIDEDWFAGETAETGGPDTLTLEDLLLRLNARLRRRPGRALYVPLAPIRSLLGMLERVSPALAPVTAGQLASFANDGVAEPHPFIRQHSGSLRGIDTMLAEMAADG